MIRTYENSSKERGYYFVVPSYAVEIIGAMVFNDSVMSMEEIHDKVRSVLNPEDLLILCAYPGALE